MKLKFLKDEELDLFNKFIDQTLRNIIAHLKFTIQNNGTIRDRSNNPIQIDDEISRFWDGVDTVKLIIEDAGFLESLEMLSSIVETERGRTHE